ncbi:hypothetical protein CPS_4330 [Colwellia psychrerythraea 34H]|uniref:Uncharacterized protein n=1 Tax=Colwellia psychrerythraea (strain 34H / ATCC BAA-681) TaxID=167879 RepID=Q47W42_COLP3|nr:hypothetical protein CPS_4330 [Colwellia psychrerythraea 34H]
MRAVTKQKRMRCSFQSHLEVLKISSNIYPENEVNKTKSTLIKIKKSHALLKNEAIKRQTICLVNTIMTL